MAKQKIDVTVAVGSVYDGKDTYLPGDHVKMEPDLAENLIKRGVVVQGKVDLGVPQQVKAAAEPQPLSAVVFTKFVNALGRLEPENENHWTADKKPEVAALKEFGCDITAAQRDEAFDLYLSESA